MKPGLLLQSLSQLYWEATRQKAASTGECAECGIKCNKCDVGKRVRIVARMYSIAVECRPRCFIRYVDDIRTTGDEDCNAALASVLHELCLKMEATDYDDLVDRYLDDGSTV